MVSSIWHRRERRLTLVPLARHARGVPVFRRCLPAIMAPERKRKRQVVRRAFGLAGLGRYDYSDQSRRDAGAGFIISPIATAILIGALLLFVRPLTAFSGRTELETYPCVAALGIFATPIGFRSRH
jgi:hypothetical protein